MKACTLLLNLLVLIIPYSLFGQTPSVSIGKKPDWVVNPAMSNARPPFREINKGFFLRQLEYQVHVDKQATYVRVIREIVSEAGVQNGSEISVSFDPVYEKLEFDMIRVWRKNQALNRL